MTDSKTKILNRGEGGGLDNPLDAAGTLVGANVAEMLSDNASEATRNEAVSSPVNKTRRAKTTAPIQDAKKTIAQPGEELSGEGSPGLTLEGGGGHA